MRQSRAAAGVGILLPIANGPIAVGPSRVYRAVGKPIPWGADNPLGVEKTRTLRLIRETTGLDTLRVAPIPSRRLDGISVAIHEKMELGLVARI